MYAIRSYYVFAPGGTLPGKGDTWVQPDLARTLQRISDNGREGFYRGETARSIAAAMQADGGILTEDRNNFV